MDVKKKRVDENFESLGEFHTRIAVAKRNGDEFVETTKEVVDYFNPNGLNGAKYFVYNGIKVTEKGLTDEIIKEESIQIGQKLHGMKEAIVESDLNK